MTKEIAKDYYEKGLQYFNSGDWDNAMDALKNSISESPDYVDAYNLLGQVYAKRNKFDAAKRCWLLSLRFDSNNATAKQLISELEDKDKEGKKDTKFKGIILPAIIVVLLAALITTNLSLIRYIDNLKSRNASLTSELTNAKATQESLQKKLASISGVSGNPDFSVVLQDRQPQLETTTTEQTSQPQQKIEELQDYPTKPIVPAKPVQTEKTFTTAAQVTEAYNEALKACFAGQYTNAMKTFQQIVSFPQSHEFKDNAQYWLAECYYGQKNYPVALAEFEKVKKNYPGTDKVFDADVKISLSYLKMGNKEQARKKLTQISREWTDLKYKSKIDELSVRIQTGN